MAAFGEDLDKTTFSVEMVEELFGRMEEPNPKNRWDSPLFVVQHKQPLPLKAIEETLLEEKKKSKDPVSTQRERVFDESFLADLNTQVQSILNQVIAQQTEALSLGGVIHLP